MICGIFSLFPCSYFYDFLNNSLTEMSEAPANLDKAFDPQIVQQKNKTAFFFILSIYGKK